MRCKVKQPNQPVRLTTTQGLVEPQERGSCGVLVAATYPDRDLRYEFDELRRRVRDVSVISRIGIAGACRCQSRTRPGTATSERRQSTRSSPVPLAEEEVPATTGSPSDSLSNSFRRSLRIHLKHIE